MASNLFQPTLGMMFLAALTNWLPAQNCGFNENLHNKMAANHQFVQQLDLNEKKMQKMMEGNPQAIMNNVLYKIPVVFHVIHKGESVGTGSNIDDQYLLQALDDLNYDFQNSGGMGTDVEIQFCLAERDEYGSFSTGINRVDGYGVGNYESIGMASSNEEVLKSLSVWPNRDYLNIWIVHAIAGGYTGFATFPGESSTVDGIVLWADATGTANYSHVITHEAGHFFGLYHTFEGACPPSNADCHEEGDKVCDTPAHLEPSGGCVTTGTACDGTTPISDVAHNYMNYTDNSCRDRFTAGQVMRMRTALMTLRNPLTYSIGCEPGCTTTTANFTVPSTEIPVGTELTFTNTSSGSGLAFIWRINGYEESTDEEFKFQFNTVGYWDVCLDATDEEGCLNRKCETIIVFNVCLPPGGCEKVKNWDFEFIEPSSDDPTIFSDVCGWQSTNSSPFYCDGPDNNAIGLLFYTDSSETDIERVTSRDLLSLDSNSFCRISFDYLVTNTTLDKIIIALTQNKNNGPLPTNAAVIAEISNPTLDYSPQGNNECYDSTEVFHHYSETFFFKGDEGLYLNISGEKTSIDSLASIVFIDNLSISCCPVTLCEPEPGFTDTIVGCTATFTGTNTGDDGDYLWDFGDGSTDTGMVVTHKFLWGDTFTVCLTIRCSDMETSATFCDEIIIPDSCNVCDTLPGARASRCDTNEVWVANFCFNVPKGFKACKDNNLFVSSPEVNISHASYQIDESSSLYDQVCITLQITSPTGYNFEQNGATGYISLCADGEVPMICRIFELYPQICDNCQVAVADTATCNDLDPNDQWRIYQGTISLTLSFAGGTFCGAWSSEAGFSIGTPSSIGATYTIPYDIVTTDFSLSSFSVLLCFFNSIDGKRHCVSVDIILPICDPFPENCVDEWSVKNMACSGIDGNGNVIVNISKSIHVGNHKLCAGGLFGTVDGGTVSVIPSSVILSGGVLNFSVNIIIPCDSFVNGEVSEMRIYLCTEEGELECYLFPFRLYCDDCAQIGGGNRSPSFTERKSSTAANQYRIIPNPANDRVSVISTAFDADKRQEARLFNHMGLLIQSVYLSSEKMEIDIGQCYPGIYYLVFSSNGALVKSEKLIILR